MHYSETVQLVVVFFYCFYRRLNISAHRCTAEEQLNLFLLKSSCTSLFFFFFFNTKTWQEDKYDLSAVSKKAWYIFFILKIHKRPSIFPSVFRYLPNRLRSLLFQLSVVAFYSLNHPHLTFFFFVQTLLIQSTSVCTETIQQRVLFWRVLTGLFYARTHPATSGDKKPVYVDGYLEIFPALS